MVRGLKDGAVVYRYSRGEKYSVLVTITNGDTAVFSDIKYPAKAPPEVVDKFLGDAEKSALEQFEKEKKYMG